MSPTSTLREAMLHLTPFDPDVAVTDQLAGRPDRRRELSAVDDHVETALEQADEVLRRVALHPGRVDIVLLELLFGDVAVIALQLLLGAKLDSVVADLALAALTMLARAIFAPVHGALRPSEDVLAHAAVELVFGAGALRHVTFSNALFTCAGTGHRPTIDIRREPTASPGMRDQLRRRAPEGALRRGEVKFSVAESNLVPARTAVVKSMSGNGARLMKRSWRLSCCSHCCGVWPADGRSRYRRLDWAAAGSGTSVTHH